MPGSPSVAQRQSRYNHALLVTVRQAVLQSRQTLPFLSQCPELVQQARWVPLLALQAVLRLAREPLPDSLLFLTLYLSSPLPQEKD